MKIPSKEDLYRRIRAIVRQEIQSVGPVQVQATGSSGVAKGIVPAAYTSGNPKIQRAHETSTTLGSKTYKVHAPITNRAGALAASDNIAYWYDPDGNKAVQGKIVDVGNVIVDADYWMGFRPVVPGNTLLLTANTERNVFGTTETIVKKFFVTRPGKYRIKGELSRDAGVATATVYILRTDAGGTGLISCGTATNNTATYPTFGAQFTVDMIVAARWGDYIGVYLSNSGGSNTSYIQNVTVNYAEASAVFTSTDSVVTD
jgi:hypothetical protein